MTTILSRPRTYHQIGKCCVCKHAVLWPQSDRIKLREAHCPRCGEPLQQTTHSISWPRHVERPIDGAAAAKKKAARTLPLQTR